MSKITIRGAENRDEVRRNRILRDTRSLFTQCWEALNEKEYALFIVIFFTVLPIVIPAITLPSFFLVLFFYLKRMRAADKEMLPFRLPVTADCLDPNDLLPGRMSGYSKAKGIFYIGQEHGTGRQLWLKAADILTHMLVMGTTGSGKTEYLVSMAFNSLVLGSGCIYIDPKGAPKLAFQMYTMCRMLGRDDDFRVMNYNTGGQSVATKGPKRMSNTQNPFAFASADAIQQLIVSLIPKSEGGNQIFSQNAQVLISGIIYGLVDLRDKKYLQMSTTTINDYLNLTLADSLARDPRLSAKAANQVNMALRNVGWRSETPLEEQLKQNKAMQEQFGYARAYFGLFLTQLGYTYGYIFGTQVGEIDLHDIILQRRTLVVILPSLEKSPQDLESLGKVTLSSVRNAIAIGLGNRLQGTAADVLFALPTDAPSPFLVITDEYAAIPTPGFAEVLTQGRGLGISAIVASQDWAGIEGADSKGAQQIAANTKVKVAMKLEDPKGTWELFKALAGQMRVMVTGGFEYNASDISGAYFDNKQSRVELEDRISIRDLQEQTEGESHIFFNGEIVRGAGFYANPLITAESQLRIPQLLPVLPPERQELAAKRDQARLLADRLAELVQGVTQVSMPQVDGESKQTFCRLSESFSHYAKLQPVERTIAAFLSVIERKTAMEQKLYNDNEHLVPAESSEDLIPITNQAAQNEPDRDDIFGDWTNAEPIIEGPKVQRFVPEGQEEDDIFLGNAEESNPDNDLFPSLDQSFLGAMESPVEELYKHEAFNIANELTQIEVAMGQSYSNAEDIAQETMDIIEKVKDYPTQPTPKAVTDEQLKSVLDTLFS